MMDQNWGRYVIYFGLLVVAVGLIIYFFGNKLSWIGNLPGDIKIEKDTFRLYFPLTTMVLISLLLTLVINVLRRLL